MVAILSHVSLKGKCKSGQGVGAVFRGVLELGGCLKGAAPSRREEVTTVVSLGKGVGRGRGG